jgi:hypothetical protein
LEQEQQPTSSKEIKVSRVDSETQADDSAFAREIDGGNTKEREKLANIAEIIELMEETHKGKDWIVDQIKQKRERVQIKPTLGTVGILKMCSQAFVSHILGLLKNEGLEEFEGPPPLTETYHWFFTDIVAGSDPTLSTNEQARKIIVLNKLIERTDIFKQRDPVSTLTLPTGDGMAMGFSDSPEKPLRLALEVHKGLVRYNKPRKEKDRIYLRIGLDTGPVYKIKDVNGNENVWGPGIIMARRVMDLAREMNILASARFANDIRMLRPEYKQILHPIGDYSIKHGEKILIYNVYGDDFGNRKPPSADKKQKSKAEEETLKTRNRFLFNSVSIELDVTDPATMLTHHTLIWNVINISNDPVDRIFYYLDGDVPRAFPDMNVTIKDEDDKELDIMSLNVNKPYHKEFFVKMRRPLKPGEKGRLIKLEWDWEEPERQFFYRFASDCKRVNYLLMVPKGVEVNQKVVKVDTETGEKMHAGTPPIVKYMPDKTQISWSASDLRAFDAFRFDW